MKIKKKALISEGKQLHKVVTDLDDQVHDETSSMDSGEKSLDNKRRLDVSWTYVGHTYRPYLPSVILKREDMLPKFKHFHRVAVDIFRKIWSYSESHTNHFEEVLEHEVFSYAP